MELDTLRDEIHKRDEEIIRLISERTKLAEQVGMYKREHRLPIRNTAVEKDVIGRYVGAGASAGLSEEVMGTVAKALIKEAVDVESALPTDTEPKRIAVIGGAGKMGAWVSEHLRKGGHEVMVIDPASDNGLTIGDCEGCDAAIVSVPIHLADRILSELDRVCGEDCLIFDLTSLKTPVIERLKAMAKTRKVCSVHPMFGPSARSMYGRNLIVCDCGNRQAVDEAKGLFDDSGGSIRIMDIAEHDRYMSYVLGLTHAVNIALFTVLQRSGYSFEDLLTVSSTTFDKGLDANRSVASEDPMLYYEIQHMNAHRDEMWSLFSSTVEELKRNSLDDDPREFVATMNAGREYFEGR